MDKVLKLGILDYTPTKYDRVYDARLARDVVVNSLREANRDLDVIFSYRYIRGLEEEIPKEDFDMFVIMGSILSPVKPSHELDKTKAQIAEIISEKAVLGICFGHHMIAQLAGNDSKELKELVIGPTEVRLYEDIEEVGKAGDTVKFPLNQIYKVTNGNRALKILAINNSGIQIADATEHFGNPVIGFQFHPEFAATDLGWRAYKNVYEITLERILSGEHPGFDLEPILKILNPRVLRRLEKSINPKYLTKDNITDEQKDLLMSPFHDISISEKRLLGTSDSIRTRHELKQKSQGVIRYFFKKAFMEKRQVKKKPVKPKRVVKKQEQMKLF